MVESLICRALLWKTDLITHEEYNTLLDKMFLQNSEDDMFLELELCSSKCEETFDILMNFWKYKFKDFSVDKFGKELMNELGRVYFLRNFSIEEFAKKTYEVWKYLPSEMNDKEPFFTLCYAGDCLSYGDEKQTRKIYEEIFGFYR